MKRTVEFQRIEDLRGATERELRSLHELSLVLAREQLPSDRSPLFEEWSWEIRSATSRQRTSCWLAWGESGEKLAGASSFTRKYLNENRHIAECNVAVRPEERRRGLAARLLSPAVEAAAGDGRTLIQGWAVEGGPGSFFADTIGAATPIVEQQIRLTIADVDVAMLHSWVDRASEKASDYSLLSWEGPCPTEFREKFSELRMVMNTAPRSESEQDALVTPEMIAEKDALAAAEGYTMWVFVARHDPTGEWAGYTSVWPSIYREEFVFQDDTAVGPEHRNRGLGRWLKAAMLLKVMKERPQARWVETWTANINEAMLGINHALGFRPVLAWQQREIPTDDLLRRLRERG